MKAQIRSSLHAARNALSESDRIHFSNLITSQLVNLESYRRSAVVMAYMSFGSEFITTAFIADLLRAGKKLVLPRVNRAEQRLTLHTVRDLRSDLVDGMWGIPEPRPETALADVASVNFILVPGLGFDAACRRLGYGRGYYDRLLAARNPDTALVAAAYSVQRVDDIPTEAHDIPVDLLVTEDGLQARP
jgi:5-formyltetrahydrofolate cyclo-ligase